MTRPILRWFSLSFILLSAACQTAPDAALEDSLFNPQQTGIRWGLVVADMEGNELIAIKPDDRFTPASNAKIITTMAAYHHLDQLEAAQPWSGTQVFVEHNLAYEHPTLVLKGGADAMLSDAPDCERTCLADLADQVAALGINRFAYLVGDDTLFPFERWGPGWSVEDLQFSYGTATSALSINDNLVWVSVAPGDEEGAPAKLEWQDGDAYLALTNQLVTTSPDIPTDYGIERYPGSKIVRFYGHVAIDQSPSRFRLAVDNPAELAAVRFQHLLEARGITVDAVASRHRPLDLIDIPPDPDTEIAQLVTAPDGSQAVARLSPTPLSESLRRISKDSQNLHAEILLRRLGLLEGSGSRAFGVRVLEALLVEAGLTEQNYALHDGSGMSIYNRVTPRGMVDLLSFAADQSWFDAWLADQPIAGVDGTLRRRFVDTPLEGKVFAKTGTLNGVNALSGLMIAASGRRLLFSIIANDRPATTRSAVAEMDAALNWVAERY